MLRQAFCVMLRQVRSFGKKRDGQVAITFGIVALPALVMTGVAIDYSRGVAQRSNLQQAADSTVLAIAHTYLTSASTNASLTSITQTYLTGTMNTIAPNAASSTTATVNGVTGTVGAATLQSVNLTQNNTSLCIKATMIIRTAIMSVVGQNYILVTATSCSQVGGTYEVAMVLDNSFSMSEPLSSGSKMDALHTAATSLVNILIPSGTTVPTAAISLVPFNALVNVGTSTSATFLDTTGQSSLNWIDIAAPNWITSRNPAKLDLFSALTTKSGSVTTKGIPWAGCVEERPNNIYRASAPDSVNYLTTDVAAKSGDSLFVPYFAPDDPGALNGAPDTNFYNYSSETYADSNSNSGSNASYTFLNSYLADTGYNGAGGACTGTSLSHYQTIDKAATNTYPRSGMTMACKYNGALATIGTQWFGLTVGPNSNCSTPAITPLTTNATTLTNAISAMQPTGLTNLGTGFMWGWRTISPTVNPFPISNPAAIGQQNPKTYNFGPPSNTKVIILMTDGYNTWSPIITTQSQEQLSASSPFLSSYESFGFMTENRLANYSTICPASGSSTANTGSGYTTDYAGFRCQMDNMLLEACTNAKAKGITIYTVGFSISSDPIDSEGQNVLQACASSANDSYIAADANTLVQNFQQIAASITNLRIAR